jgi:hypothetical protein
MVLRPVSSLPYDTRANFYPVVENALFCHCLPKILEKVSMMIKLIVHKSLRRMLLRTTGQY